MISPGRLFDYDLSQVNSQGYQAAQLSDADLGQYMNPYTQDVIDTTMADLGRGRDSAMNATGVVATRGGAVWRRPSRDHGGSEQR